MTRQEFYDTVDNWRALLSFCSENDCEICDDVIDYDDFESLIDGAIIDYLHTNYWHELREELDAIPQECDYYIKGAGCLEYRSADDDDFYNYLSDVADWCENNDIFDYEPEDEDMDEDDDGILCPFDEPEEEPEEELPAPEEDFSIDVLIEFSTSSYTTAKAERPHSIEETGRELQSLMNLTV